MNNPIFALSSATNLRRLIWSATLVVGLAILLGSGPAIAKGPAKVEFYDASGNMASEVHGQAHRFEISPGASIGCYFYPMAKGNDLPIESTRRDAPVMTGRVEIFGAPPITSK